MIRKILLFVFVFTGLTPVSVIGQNPGQNILVTLQIDSVTISGDTIGVESRVANSSGSSEALFVFMVDAPAGITEVRLPSPNADWDVDSNYRLRPMAVWSALALVQPGSTSPALYFQSQGVPGIVNYWARGKFQRGADEDIADDGTPYDPLSDRMITGKTVGVEPWPVSRSATDLLTRLRTLTQSSCQPPLLWVTDTQLCDALLDRIDQAASYEASGQASQARAKISEMVTLISGATSGTFAPGVTSAGFWLLKANADILTPIL